MHSGLVGGSTAERMIKCPANYQMQRAIQEAQGTTQEPPSVYAMEGTACHHIMEQCLLAWEAPHTDLIGKTIEGVKITGEIFRGKLVPAWEQTMELFERLNIDEFEPEVIVGYTESLPEAFGTADIVGRSEVGRKPLVVADYKFGHNVVSPVENSQLKFYAGAAFETVGCHDWIPEGDPTLPVVFAIIQPAAGRLQTWETTWQDVHDFTDDLVRACFIATSEEPSHPVPGDHCKYCPVASICPAKSEQAKHALRLNLDDLEQLAAATALAFELESWVKTVKEKAHQQLDLGAQVRGYKLVKKRATRSWTDAEAVMELFKRKRKLTREDYTVAKLLSPAQIEKVCAKKGVDMDEFANYIDNSSSGTTLAPESDKRPAVAVGGAKEVTGSLAEKMKRHS
jgi:hypothetical protein